MTKRILVVGELFQDKFALFKSDRLCPEEPVPILTPVRTESNDGGAGNVVCNIKSLSPETEVHFIHQKSIITKTRLIDEASGHFFLRIDENDRVPENEKLTEQKILDYLFIHQLTWDDLDAVVISDYGKGFVGKEIIQFLAQNHTETFLDTKYILNSFSEHIFIVKINNKELQNNLRDIPNPENFCLNLVVTLGKDGAKLIRKGREDKLIKSNNEVKVMNLSGAGDTFLSMLVISYLEGKNIEESIDCANKAAAYSVSQKGVIAVPRGEVFNG